MKITDLKPNEAIHCKTLEEIREARIKLGYGDDGVANTIFGRYGENSVVYHDDRGFSDTNWAIDNGYSLVLAALFLSTPVEDKVEVVDAGLAFINQIKTIENMNNFNPTCFATGETDRLKMHALRNEQGAMIGWVFVSENLDVNPSSLIQKCPIEIETRQSQPTPAPVKEGKALSEISDEDAIEVAKILRPYQEHLWTASYGRERLNDWERKLWSGKSFLALIKFLTTNSYTL